MDPVPQRERKLIGPFEYRPFAPYDSFHSRKGKAFPALPLSGRPPAAPRHAVVPSDRWMTPSNTDVRKCMLEPISTPQYVLMSCCKQARCLWNLFYKAETVNTKWHELQMNQEIDWLIQRLLNDNLMSLKNNHESKIRFIWMYLLFYSSAH